MIADPGPGVKNLPGGPPDRGEVASLQGSVRAKDKSQNN
jgi:hypothetical protein